MYDIADEIRELKELLKDELITQEEFDAKKKQLLGI
ncbi:SHOCT domain-containing protein [Lysinibacillus sp. NPDC095746]